MTIHRYATVTAGWIGYVTASDDRWTLFIAEDGSTFLALKEPA